MAALTFPVRYYCMYPIKEGTDCTESSFGHQEIDLELKTEHTALILVDIWNVEQDSASFGAVGKEWACKFRGGKSLQERVRKITKDTIRPTADAARKAGILVVHAPTEHVAMKYEQYRRQNREVKSAHAASDWPPPEFKRQRTRRILELRYGKGAAEADKLRESTYDDISELVKPQPQDHIIATGEGLNQILKERGVLNLIYVGFATNLCLFIKPGGLMEMWDRGYNIIVLRDCTTTVETCHFGTGICDEIAIDWLEVYSFFTADSQNFISACEKIT